MHTKLHIQKDVLFSQGNKKQLEYRWMREIRNVGLQTWFSQVRFLICLTISEDNPIYVVSVKHGYCGIPIFEFILWTNPSTKSVIIIFWEVFHAWYNEWS